MEIQFEFYSSKLFQLDIPSDIRDNPDFIIQISQFELHVFGVVNQYNRIHQELLKGVNGNQSQVRLDIYYLLLTWDKVKKIYKKMKDIINKISINDDRLINGFTNDFRILGKRFDNLYNDLDPNHNSKKSIRNEYEHPSLKFYNGGWYGNMEINPSGDIRIHVGGEIFYTVKNNHVERLNLLRIDFIDLFLKYFSKRKLISELLELRNDITQNIDQYVKEYQGYIRNKEIEKSNVILNQLIKNDIYLTMESVPLSETTKNKFYPLLIGSSIPSVYK